MTIPEYRKLCVAVFVMALEDLVKSNSDTEDAMQWVHSNKDVYLFDFIVICRVLGVDSKGIRDAVKDNKIRYLLDEYKNMRISQRTPAVEPLPKISKRTEPDRFKKRYSAARYHPLQALK